jgi:hypothetical protein
MFLGWGESTGAYQLSRVAPAVERAERMKVIMVGALGLGGWCGGCSPAMAASCHPLNPLLGHDGRSPSHGRDGLSPFYASQVTSCHLRSSYRARHGPLGRRCCPVHALRRHLGGGSARRGHLGHRWRHHRRHRSGEGRARPPPLHRHARVEVQLAWRGLPRREKGSRQLSSSISRPGSAVTLWALAMSWSATATRESRFWRDYITLRGRSAVQRSKLSRNRCQSGSAWATSFQNLGEWLRSTRCATS